MKAILIARVSTEEQKEAGNSLPAQEARLEKYCQIKGFKIVKTFSFDESAYKNQRDEFDFILDFIAQHKEKIAVCCDKVDRLSRNIFDKRVSALYEKALSDELELHFVSDGQIITSRISAVEKFQFSISLGLAKYYSDAISDNVKRAHEQKLRKGEWLSKAPYGYKNIKKPDGSTDVIVDEFQAGIVKQLFELYATGSFSEGLLVAKLKKDYNMTWSRGYMHQFLNNQFYHGVMLVKDKTYPHRYPPIITKTLFDQVQSIKASYNKKPVKFAGLNYIYRGLLRCGDCGCVITPEQHKGRVYYHCTQSKGKHGATWYREDKLTEILGNVFKSFQVPKNILKEIIDILTELHQGKAEFQAKLFDELGKEHKTITKMMDNLYLDKLKGRITESEYDRFYQNFRDQIININIRIEQLQEADDNYYITAKYVLKLANKAYDLFISSEMEDRRQLIKLLLSNLRIEGENVLYDVAKPFDMILNCSDRQLWRG